MVARIDRASYGSPEESHHNRVWDHEGQLNIIVFNALLQDPYTDLAEVTWRWAEEYYGEAHPFALKALEDGVGIFHDMYYVYPGEDIDRHWRGAWLTAETLMDERYGIFGALREAGGYRTPKELAIIRCEAALAGLRLGQGALNGCSRVQIQHYQSLQAKFESLLAFGRQRLAFLGICATFGELFFQHGNILRNKSRFIEAVDRFQEIYDRQDVDRFSDRIGAQEYSATIQALFDLLKNSGKMDPKTYDGYCAAGEV
jgi:hypothetical protein